MTHEIDLEKITFFLPAVNDVVECVRDELGHVRCDDDDDDDENPKPLTS